MPIKVTCQICQGVLHVPDDSLGKKGRCPTCGNILSIVDVSFNEADRLSTTQLNQADRTATLKRVEELVIIHHWKLAPVIESMLFAQPVSRRLNLNDIRNLCRSLDLDVSQLEATVDELLKNNRIRVDSYENTPSQEKQFFMERARRAEFEGEGSRSTKRSGQSPIAENFSQGLASHWRRKLLRVLARALIVAIITGIGSQVGGWAGAIVTGVLATIVTMLIPGIGDHNLPQSGH
jgi:hypothetical protein